MSRPVAPPQAEPLRQEGPRPCAACGEPCRSGSRWCSDSCFRQEDGDYRMDDYEPEEDEE